MMTENEELLDTECRSCARTVGEDVLECDLCLAGVANNIIDIEDAEFEIERMRYDAFLDRMRAKYPDLMEEYDDLCFGREAEADIFYLSDAEVYVIRDRESGMARPWMPSAVYKTRSMAADALRTWINQPLSFPQDLFDDE